MKTEIFLTDINYADLKQYLDYANCSVVNDDLFRDLYFNSSYFVPNDILGDKWKVIQFITDMLISDYQTIKF